MHRFIFLLDILVVLYLRICSQLPGTLWIRLWIWTSRVGNTPQDTNYTATCLPSRKLYKLNEPDMQDTAGEAGKSS